MRSSSDGSAWEKIDGVASEVLSFNGRTGTVAPQSGDYTASLVGLGNVTNNLQLAAANNLSDLASVATARQTSASGQRPHRLRRRSTPRGRGVRPQSAAERRAPDREQSLRRRQCGDRGHEPGAWHRKHANVRRRNEINGNSNFSAFCWRRIAHGGRRRSAAGFGTASVSVTGTDTRMTVTCHDHSRRTPKRKFVSRSRSPALAGDRSSRPVFSAWKRCRRPEVQHTRLLHCPAPRGGVTTLTLTAATDVLPRQKFAIHVQHPPPNESRSNGQQWILRLHAGPRNAWRAAAGRRSLDAVLERKRTRSASSRLPVALGYGHPHRNRTGDERLAADRHLCLQRPQRHRGAEGAAGPLLLDDGAGRGSAPIGSQLLPWNGAALATLDDVAAGWTTVMTEAYAANGSPMTPAEALYMIYAASASSPSAARVSRRKKSMARQRP